MPSWTDDEGNCHWQEEGERACYEDGPCPLHRKRARRSRAQTPRSGAELRELLMEVAKRALARGSVVGIEGDESELAAEIVGEVLNVEN